MSLRSTLYKLARVLGDINAAEHGRLPQRMVRKFVYRHTLGHTARLLNKILR